MTNLGSLSRQGKSLATVIAASGSFLIGMLLPMEIWTNQQTNTKATTVKTATNTNTVKTATSTKTINQSVNSKETPLEIIKISSVVAKKINNTKQKLRELELKTFNFSVPKRFQSQTVKNITLNSKQKVISLTFDDGPWNKTTEQILDILKKHNIRATFFVVGQHLNVRQEIGKKIVEEGHVIANHTWNHPSKKSKMSPDLIKSEIGRTADLIYKITGRTTNLFRPPGGVLVNGLADYAKERKHTVVLWSADSVDWYYRSAKEITKKVLNKASNGGIVLLHDGGGPRGHVVEALPNIIAGLKKQGYEFVTIPELLTIKDRELHQEELAKQREIKKQETKAEGNKE
ncbi:MULTISPECIES: polysaccharide deacetylase family protein [Okeania]|uniref:Polysaccharide deacetylase family protein n=3 Tax=Okeania TaxID=1458928 RepID=A0A3N6N596_9CYAN|nr:MULTISPECIES: polysaccharide deacetylase family protein [Okeania]NEP05382.1 polysaccharide deacetylase family protein [Okeania sp. SIO4D6]NET14425.1 polysaccharide deacetylase family protein [Okeania sp. SIO1H6]NEP72710.1 polysaccharide deacetylase family protein [Okeania sp. SIO2G5]NEP96671.1 polysaccharide deacetylase family protein [Okeania sp. SIO2F5]NEQ91330.1 polysaccharide deacetylase family protein [Okeania sp. SIO2G4]